MVLAGLNNTFWDGGWLTPRLRRRRDGSVEGGTAAPRPLGHARCRTREPAVEPRTRSRVAVESAATPRRAAADEAATPRAKHSSAETRNGRPPVAGARAMPNTGASGGTTTAGPSRGRERRHATQGCRRRSGNAESKAQQRRDTERPPSSRWGTRDAERGSQRWNHNRGAEPRPRALPRHTGLPQTKRQRREQSTAAPKTRSGRPPAAGTRAKPNAGAGDGTTTAEPSRGRPRGNATRGCRRRSGCPQQPREHCTTRHLGLKAARGRRSGCPSSRRSTARRSGAWGPRPHGAASPKAKHSGAEARDGRSPAASTRA